MVATSSALYAGLWRYGAVLTEMGGGANEGGKKKRSGGEENLEARSGACAKDVVPIRRPRDKRRPFLLEVAFGNGKGREGGQGSSIEKGRLGGQDGLGGGRKDPEKRRGETGGRERWIE